MNLILAVLSLQALTFGCKTSGGDDSSDAKRRISSQQDLDDRIAGLSSEARDDLRYVLFYKDGSGKMNAKLTKDVNGNDVEMELGLISWAPNTVGEATANYKQHKQYGAKYFIEDVATLSNKKKIFHFMPIKGNFALHSAYLGGVPRSGQRPSLLANGYKDPSGHGCIRIANATATTGGHEFLFARVKSLKAKYGLANIPVVIDYAPFIDPRVMTTPPVNQEVPLFVGGAASISSPDMAEPEIETVEPVRDFDVSGDNVEEVPAQLESVPVEAGENNME